MSNQQEVELFWQAFLADSGINNEKTYEAWAFGDSPEMADELLGLVLEGTKTGTTSALAAYEYEQEPLPLVGSYSICLDGKGIPRCVIQTVAIKTVPFKEITAADAYKEGEGDRSLAYWRKVHQDFWERELVAYDMPFSDELLVLYEEFKVID